MNSKKGFSFFRILITIMCFAMIIVALFANIAFSKNKTPELFGKYIYIVGEDNPMGDDLTAGAAIIANDAKDISLIAGDIVLCYPADSPDTLTVRSINAVVPTEDGSERYYTRDAIHEDNIDSIGKESIAAVCTGYPSSLELGQLIKFSTSLKGIFAFLLLPCIILVVLLIARIASSKNEEEDGEYGFYDFDGNEREHRQPKNSDPLYEPNNDVQPSAEFERKKMSIADNFSQKEVNHNSPYQKEKERTMQFKAQIQATSTFNAVSQGGGTAESSFAARNHGGQSSTAPTADALREEMLRKTAEAERTGTFSIKSNSIAQSVQRSSEPVSDNTGILSKAELEKLSRGDAPAPVKQTPPPVRPQPQPAKPAPAPRKSSSPDISDILGKSSINEKKKSPSNMSVDDLLKMIEDEKNRL